MEIKKRYGLSIIRYIASVSLIFFPVVYRKFGRLIRGRGPYIIEGMVEDDFGHTPLKVENIIIIQDK